ncbi:branched-chain amino acid ABC transporter permease [Xylanimonas ulmi]|uniref:Amino acid/amide ABC transporter membrane protein 2 (HAAT family) n=1 Tax=Xylanimonas ulmi TaxID=228973 RepID=A0A4V2EY28_9MICO|nr:branched-chain amino acid ABC transporter permease [Xylanibacterium ulmi]RZS61540.1 amino acid/amide ABC transporter membrane protein 2 (HAAT family) [Xylanibacterium ulmi]
MSRARALVAALLVALVVAPHFLDRFWLQVGSLTMAAAIAAIGLTLLVGVAGQISLAHAVFVGLGAYGYIVLAAPSDAAGWGLGLPTPLAAIGGVTLAGLAGLAISPLSGRVSGLYLAVVTIGLVFIWQHALQEVEDFSGGYAGRPAPELSVLGLSLGESQPWHIAQVPYGGAEKTWLLSLAALVCAFVAARNIARGRPGLALAMIKENEIGARSLGVDVRRGRAAVFGLASLYAGVAGVLMALTTQFVTPQSFGFQLSTDYLVMVIIGGVASVRGAVAGALFVTVLPRVLGQYTDGLPFLARVGSGGIDANVLSVFVYCALLLVVIMFARGGLDRLLGLLVSSRRASAVVGH